AISVFFAVDSLTGVDEATRARLTAAHESIRAAILAAQDEQDLVAAVRPVVFALARTVGARRQRYGQVEGAAALTDGRKLVKFPTGEGKTDLIGLAASLEALTGQVHVHVRSREVAVNNASRMAPLYGALGLTVGILSREKPGFMRINAQGEAVFEEARIEDVLARSQVLYGQTEDYHFEYLIDTSAGPFSANGRTAPILNLAASSAIVDEADEALLTRTPKIMSAPGVDDISREMKAVNDVMTEMVKAQETSGAETYYTVTRDASGARAQFTDAGYRAVERALTEKGFPARGLFRKESPLRTMAEQSLTAHAAMERGRTYIVSAELSQAAEALSVPEAFLLAQLSAQGTITGATAEEQRAAFQNVDIETIVGAIDKLGIPAEHWQKVNREEALRKLRQAGAVVIVGETGYRQTGSRWEAYLHEAVEAKEGLAIGMPGQTLSSIDTPRFFSLYHRIGATTATPGDAETRHGLYGAYYGLSVYNVGRNTPTLLDESRVQRRVFRTTIAKAASLVDEILTRHERGQPVLAGGPIDVSFAEAFASLFNNAISAQEWAAFASRGYPARMPVDEIAHHLGCTPVEVRALIQKIRERGAPAVRVLDASTQSQRDVIATTAGERGAITVATNIAGREMDISLGAGVKELGGLHVASASMSDSVRLDTQVLGRSARQGNPGSASIAVSLQDTFLRECASPEQITFMDRQLAAADDLEAQAMGRISAERQRELLAKAESARAGVVRMVRAIQEAADSRTVETRVAEARRDHVFAAQQQFVDDLREALSRGSAVLPVLGDAKTAGVTDADRVLSIGFDPNIMVSRLVAGLVSSASMTREQALFTARNILMQAIDKHKAGYGSETKQQALAIAQIDYKSESLFFDKYTVGLRDAFTHFFREVMAEATTLAGAAAQQKDAYTKECARQALQTKALEAAPAQAAAVAAASRARDAQMRGDRLTIEAGIRHALMNEGGMGIIIPGARSRARAVRAIAFTLADNPALCNRYYDTATGHFDRLTFSLDMFLLQENLQPFCLDIPGANPCGYALTLLGNAEILATAIGQKWVEIDAAGTLQINNGELLVKALRGGFAQDVKNIQDINLIHEAIAAVTAGAPSRINIESALEGGIQAAPVSAGVFKVAVSPFKADRSKEPRVLIVRVRADPANPGSVQQYLRAQEADLTALVERVALDATPVDQVVILADAGIAGQDAKALGRIQALYSRISAAGNVAIRKYDEKTGSATEYSAQELASFTENAWDRMMAGAMSVAGIVQEAAAGVGERAGAAAAAVKTYGPRVGQKILTPKGAGYAAYAATTLFGAVMASAATPSSPAQREINALREDLRSGRVALSVVDYCARMNALLEKVIAEQRAIMEPLQTIKAPSLQSRKTLENCSREIERARQQIADNDQTLQRANRREVIVNKEIPAVVERLSGLQADLRAKKITVQQFKTQGDAVIAEYRALLEEAASLAPVGGEELKKGIEGEVARVQESMARSAKEIQIRASAATLKPSDVASARSPFILTAAPVAGQAGQQKPFDLMSAGTAIGEGLNVLDEADKQGKTPTLADLQSIDTALKPLRAHLDDLAQKKALSKAWQDWHVKVEQKLRSLLWARGKLVAESLKTSANAKRRSDLVTFNALLDIEFSLKSNAPERQASIERQQKQMGEAIAAFDAALAAQQPAAAAQPAPAPGQSAPAAQQPAAARREPVSVRVPAGSKAEQLRNVNLEATKNNRIASVYVYDFWNIT
ncbi:MAG: hypothetical protein WCG78_06205, partial [Candidatus Omnitrophota bacterium]